MFCEVENFHKNECTRCLTGFWILFWYLKLIYYSCSGWKNLLMEYLLTLATQFQLLSELSPSIQITFGMLTRCSITSAKSKKLVPIWGICIFSLTQRINFEFLVLDTWSAFRPYHFKYFKGCLLQISLGPFLNTLFQLCHYWCKSKCQVRFLITVNLLFCFPVKPKKNFFQANFIYKFVENSNDFFKIYKPSYSDLTPGVILLFSRCLLKSIENECSKWV